ncbi:MAG TPA: hypothetical protein VMI56_01400 [Reyranella sp.]|nr:hypothetical protein [Reyranella sp.]
MSFPRLDRLLLPIALALLAGACGAPLAVTAGSYGADVGSLAATGKSGSDHFASMVSKRDCALWRVFVNQSVCHDRDSDHDPYDVNYNEPFRQATEGGVEYSPPAHATANVPNTSWTASAYEAPPAATPETPPAQPVQAVAETPPAPVPEAAPVHPAKLKKPKPAHSAKHVKKKAPMLAAPKPSPDQAASRT